MFMCLVEMIKIYRNCCFLILSMGELYWVRTFDLSDNFAVFLVE